MADANRHLTRAFEEFTRVIDAALAAQEEPGDLRDPIHRLEALIRERLG